MSILTVTTKGQVTLRKEILRHLGIEPGEKVVAEMLPDGRVEVRAAPRTGLISDVFGMLKRPGQPVLTIEEISESAAEGWAGKR